MEEAAQIKERKHSDKRKSQHQYQLESTKEKDLFTRRGNFLLFILRAPALQEIGEKFQPKRIKQKASQQKRKKEKLEEMAYYICFRPAPRQIPHTILQNYNKGKKKEKKRRFKKAKLHRAVPQEQDI